VEEKENLAHNHKIIFKETKDLKKNKKTNYLIYMLILSTTYCAKGANIEPFAS
jgi:hypothetical protein